MLEDLRVRSVFLSVADIELVTGKVRPSAQCRALDRMMIEYRLADNGFPLVRAEALDDDGKSVRRAPRWDRMVA